MAPLGSQSNPVRACFGTLPPGAPGATCTSTRRQPSRGGASCVQLIPRLLPRLSPVAQLISLVALAQGGPTFASVANGGGSSINSCSTQSAPADQCSVTNATNAICSAATTDLPGFCSAASGTASLCSTMLRNYPRTRLMLMWAIILRCSDRCDAAVDTSRVRRPVGSARGS